MPTPADRIQTTLRKGKPEEGARVRAALVAGQVGLWFWDLVSGELELDAGIIKDLNAQTDSPDSPESRRTSPRELLRHVDPYDRRRFLKLLSRALTDRQPISVELRLRLPDGGLRWMAVRGGPTSAKEGNIREFSGVAYDITDQKLNLKRTDALLREVSHRSKNILALILAMARLTAREASDVKSHLKDFTLRVAGLSASQDLIVASDWRSVELATLASAEIGAVARTDTQRIKVSGPPVLVTPEAAQTLGMILTELALNSVQHGALTSATGKVHLEWELPTATTIIICWH
jgi:two-component sensor histidine kinase